ncbi:MAG TPA: patatin-like phospholipase family protein [Mycobacteriales bacterium]|nr:patatin-like phospholipase family protein [Mycobacteriales bacterium]
MTVRRGLVLGAGGVLGASWTTGALVAARDALGWDPAEADVMIGTSAGSVLVAALSCGVTVDELLAHQRGEVVDERIAFDPDRDSGGALPPLPRPMIGSARGVLHTALHPRSKTPMGALAAVLPRGRGSIDALGRLVDGVLPDGGWAPHPAAWIVAAEYDTGRRVAFGRAGAPRTDLRDAVMASCAIPGWYAPVTIQGRRYVDGGVCSPTSVDLLLHEGLDEVLVLSPMTSLTYDQPATVAGRLERRFRRLMTKRSLAEVKRVAARGAKVHFLGPTAEDLEAIGTNLMEPSRRTAVLETSLRTSGAALGAGREPAA